MENKKGFLKSLKSVSYAAIFLLIIFSGCATKGELKSVSDEEALRERIMAYCNNKINGESEKNYEYEDPLFRKTTSRSTYVRRVSNKTVQWLDANIKNIETGDDKAIVDLKIRVKTMLLGQMPVPPKVIERDSEVRHLWVKSDGVWFHAYKPKGLQEDEGEN